MMSGMASGTRSVPGVYSQLSPKGKHGIGQAKDIKQRDKQHARSKGNRLRQKEEAREFHRR
jgi:hypothetical protein